MNIAVVGSINMDQTITCERLPHAGETVLGSHIHYAPGGKGANQAVAMARLGAQVSMFGVVGNDANGHALIKNLQANGVDTQGVEVIETVPTGLALITVDETDNTIVVISGANACVDKSFIERIQKQLIGFDMVVMQHEIPHEAILTLIEFCYENNIATLCNPAPAVEVLPETLSKLTYLTPNEHEAAYIFGKKTPTESILRAWPEKVIITQGERGAQVGLATGEVLAVPARQSHVVDTTGAGDTFNAAFCVRMVAGDDLQTALIYANTAASLAIGHLGAQGGMPTAVEVERAL